MNELEYHPRTDFVYLPFAVLKVIAYKHMIYS